MKFKSLFLKELREMLNKQTIAMLVIMFIVMYGVGGMVNKSIEKANEESSSITICDQDDTKFSQSVINFLKKPTADMENKVKIVDVKSDDYAKELKRLKVKSFVIIPKGFSEKINGGEQAQVVYVGKMTSTATMANMNVGSETAVQLIQAAVKSAIYQNKISKGQLSEKETVQLEAPVAVKEQTIVGSKSAEISQLVLYSAISSQSLMMPLIVYVLIMMGSLSMVNAVAAEKLDKTLETLLSAPISRTAVRSKCLC